MSSNSDMNELEASLLEQIEKDVYYEESVIAHDG